MFIHYTLISPEAAGGAGGSRTILIMSQSAGPYKENLLPHYNVEPRTPSLPLPSLGTQTGAAAGGLLAQKQGSRATEHAWCHRDVARCVFAHFICAGTPAQTKNHPLNLD